jgi:hypothetical protein
LSGIWGTLPAETNTAVVSLMNKQLPMHDLDEDRSYEDMFIIFSNRVEKAVVTLVILLLFALMLSQLLLQHPWIRYQLVKVEQLEGKLYTELPPESGDGK